MRCEKCGGNLFREDGEEFCFMCGRPRVVVRPDYPSPEEMRAASYSEARGYRKFDPKDWE